MASVISTGNGGRAVQFFGHDGRRRTIRLGTITLTAAREIAAHVDALAAAKRTGDRIPPRSAAWLDSLSPWLAARLAAVGLIEPHRTARLRAFLAEYIDGRADVKQSTRTVWKRTQRHLETFFKADPSLTEITPGDAERFDQYLAGAGLARNTRRRTVGICKQFFAYGIRCGLLTRNPFAHLAALVGGDPDRQYIDRAAFAKVLEATTQTQLRTILGLARYQGLRIPSEAVALTWADVDKAARRLTVRSEKTKHHEGRGRRIVPLFPEMAELLAAQREITGTAEKVIVGADEAKNWRTSALKAIKRAGLTPWRKLFHALRASCATDLTGTVGSYAAAQWLGHSERIAHEHYLSVRDSDFDKALHSALQTGGDKTGRERTSRQASGAESTVFAVFGGSWHLAACAVVDDLGYQVGGEGLSQNDGKQSDDNGLRNERRRSAAPGAAPDPESMIALRFVASKWPTLPAIARLQILGLAASGVPIPV